MCHSKPSNKLENFQTKLVTFFLAMAVGSVSQAQLKRGLDQLSQDLNNIDLQIQQLRQGSGNNQQYIATLKATKLEIQREVVAKQVELKHRKPQGRKRWCQVGIPGGQGLRLPEVMYWESCSMNHLTWPFDYRHLNIVGQPRQGATGS